MIRRAVNEKRKPPPVLSASRKQGNLVGNIRLDVKKGKLFSKGVPIHEVLRGAEAKLFELRASERTPRFSRVRTIERDALRGAALRQTAETRRQRLGLDVE